MQDNRHRSLLRFVRRIIDVPLGYSKDDLAAFRSAASRDYPSLVPLIDEYLKLAVRSDSDVTDGASAPRPRTGSRPRPKADPGQMHLFDLLREKRLFPLNADLSGFAERVLPRMSRHRFDKMSRGDIAARIIEYLEARDPRTREELEASMREAMRSDSGAPADRTTFLSTWEKIIKGVES